MKARFAVVQALLPMVALTEASLGASRPGWGLARRCGGSAQARCWGLYGNSALLCSQDTTHCGFTSPPAYATTLLSSAHPGAAAHTLVASSPRGFAVLLRHSTLRGLGLLRAARVYGWGVNWVGQTGNRTGSTLRGWTGWRHGATHSRGGVAGFALKAHVSTVLNGYFVGAGGTQRQGQGRARGEGDVAYFVSLLQPAMHGLVAIGSHTVYRANRDGFDVRVLVAPNVTARMRGAEEAERAGWVVQWIGVERGDGVGVRDVAGSIAANAQRRSREEGRAQWAVAEGTIATRVSDGYAGSAADQMRQRAQVFVTSLVTSGSTWSVSHWATDGRPRVRRGEKGPLVYLAPWGAHASPAISLRIATFYDWRVACLWAHCTPSSSAVSPPTQGSRVSSSSHVVWLDIVIALQGTDKLDFERGVAPKLCQLLRTIVPDTNARPALVEVSAEGVGASVPTARVRNAVMARIRLWFADRGLRDAARFVLADPSTAPRLRLLLVRRGVVSSRSSLTFRVPPSGSGSSAQLTRLAASEQTQTRNTVLQKGHTGIDMLLAAVIVVLVVASTALLFFVGYISRQSSGQAIMHSTAPVNHRFSLEETSLSQRDLQDI